MDFAIGDIVDGTVTGITKFGAFVTLPGNITGLVHISEVSHEYIKDINSVLSTEEKVKVKILKWEGDGKVSLSIKKALPKQAPKARKAAPSPMGFEDMMKRFMQDSNERQGELRRHNEGKNSR